MPDQPDDVLEIIVKRLKLPVGQNDKDESDAIEEDQAVLMQNVVATRKGRMITRGGSTLLANRVGSLAVDALGHFYPAGGTKLQLALMNTHLYKRQSGDTTWTSIASSLASGSPQQFLVAGGYIFICDGTNNVRQYDGTTLTTLGNTNTDFPKFKFGIYQQNYCIVCTGLDSLIYVSTVLVPTTWDRTAGVLKLSTGDNGLIKALVSVPLLSNDAIIAFKTDSTHIVNIISGGLANWTTQVLDPIHGCVATRSAIAIGSGELQGGVLYLCKETAENGSSFYRVRSIKRTLYGSHVPGPVVSYDIEATLNAMNPIYDAGCAAYFHNNKYLLAFPSASATYNDTVAVLDLTISSIDEGKFRWSIITGWTPAMFDIFDEGSVQYLMFGDSSANSQVFQAFKGTSDNGTAIDAKITGRAEDGGYPELNKTYEFVEVYFDSTDTTPVTVRALFDNGSAQTLGTVATAAAGVNLPQTLPFNLQDVARVRAKFPLDSQICRNVSIEVEDSTLNSQMAYLGYVLAGWAENISFRE